MTSLIFPLQPLLSPVHRKALPAAVAVLARLHDALDLSVIGDFTGAFGHHVGAAEHALHQRDLEEHGFPDPHEVQRAMPGVGGDADDRGLVDIILLGIVAQAERKLDMSVPIARIE